MKTELTEQEIEILRPVLSSIVIESRTGELGILHGADRFVGIGIILKKDGRKALNDVAKKVGVSAGIRERSK